MVVYMDPLGIRVPVSEGSKGGSRVFGLKAAPGLADTGLGLLGFGVCETYIYIYIHIYIYIYIYIC